MVSVPGDTDGSTDTRNWLSASKDYAGQRFVDLNQINAGNAARLRPVCIYPSNSAIRR